MSVVKANTHQARKCKEGMLNDYMEYSIYQESPPDFHLWCLISAIATALGRNCWVNMGMWENYPNMYIILVGESAITHKSTAIKMMVRPLRRALPDLPTLSQKMTPESLIHTLSILSESDEGLGRAEAYVVASELANLIGKSKMDDSFLKLLTELWDSDDTFSYSTMGRGVEKLKDVCINLLGGSTKKWLSDSIPESSLEGGFFSRLILVVREPDGRKNPCPTINAHQREALENVKHDLVCIRDNMRGEFILEPQAQQLFNEWYHEHNHPQKAESFMRGYYGRKGDFLQKVAMCLSASYSDDLLITYDDMSLALRLLNENEIHAKGLVKYMGTTAEGVKYNTVVNLIKRSVVKVPPDDTSGMTREQLRNSANFITKRGISHSELLRKVAYRYTRDDVLAVLESLSESQDIIATLVPPRNGRVYLWNGKEGE